jgi:hypothetical protein
VDSLFSQLPNGGAVVAIIVIVVIFLKRQDHHDERLQAIANRFADDLAAARKDYLDHLRELTGRPRPKS